MDPIVLNAFGWDRAVGRYKTFDLYHGLVEGERIDALAYF